MNNAVILRTNTIATNAKYGLDKVIVNFPEGSVAIPNGVVVGIIINRLTTTTKMKIRTYNGKLHSVNNFDMDNAIGIETDIDSDNNIIRTYSIPGFYYTEDKLVCFKLEAGTTRCEICDFHNYTSAFYGACTYGEKIEDGEIDISQIPVVGMTTPRFTYNSKIKGNLSSLKDYDGLVNAAFGGTSIEGDVANLVASARKNLFKDVPADEKNVAFTYDTQVYGDFATVLDAMKDRLDLRGSTVGGFFYGTQVTYRGTLINQGGMRKFAIDAQGNHSMIE